MTWETLARLLETIPGLPAPAPGGTAAVVRALEAKAESDPTDRRIALALRALHDFTVAGDGLPTEIGGVHRERLVGWDAWTATWVGTDLATGGEGLVRAVRAVRGDAPTLRAMAREARALGSLVPGLRAGDGWLAAPLPGDALAPRPQAPALRLARLATTGIGALARWEAAGLWPRVAAEQWRETEGGLVLVALDATAPDDAGPALAELAGTLVSDDEGETSLEQALSALCRAPPHRAADALPSIVAALASDLAARRHELYGEHRRTAHVGRATRLHDLLVRLQAAVPAPAGRGAIGVDLDGRVTAIETRPGGLWWGAEGAMVPLWTRDRGFDAAEARRMLRARAQAPASDRMQAQVGGDPTYPERAGRWVAASLRLRTVRMLLEHASGA